MINIERFNKIKYEIEGGFAFQLRGFQTARCGVEESKWECIYHLMMA